MTLMRTSKVGCCVVIAHNHGSTHVPVKNLLGESSGASIRTRIGSSQQAPCVRGGGWSGLKSLRSLERLVRYYVVTASARWPSSHPVTASEHRV
jgi:hypothetical protein